MTYKGKTIADTLEMTVAEALKHFENVPRIRRMLQTLNDVGLDYIKLGQSAITLSGGEAQRVKLSKELSRPGTGKTIYLLDEPTTGLHFDDIRKLLGRAQPAGGQREYGAGDRAQPRHHQDGGLDRRSRSRRR